MTDDTTADPPAKGLPAGTPPQFERMHTIIRRVCYVLLFALVAEGALTFPLLALWYGFPSLSADEVCDELHRAMYSDGTYECEQPVPLPGPPFAGESEGEGQRTSRDDWGIQPSPGYPAIDYRELVERHEACEAWRDDPDAADVPPDDYCNYVAP